MLLFRGRRLGLGVRQLGTANEIFPPLPPAIAPATISRFKLLSPSVRERVEGDDISLLERLGDLALTLKTCVIPSRHPLNAISANVRGKLASRPLNSELEVLRVLDDLAAELTPPALPDANPPKKVGMLRRLFSTSKTAEAPLPTKMDVRFPGAALSTEEVKALDELLACHHGVLATYGVLSLDRQFVQWDDSKQQRQSHNQLRPERGYELEWQFPAQTVLRVALLRHYLLRLRKAVTEGDVPAARLQGDVALARLTDAVLLGTSSERLFEHLSLFSGSGQETFTLGKLQDAFYTIFEPEVLVAMTIIAGPVELLPEHRKNLPVHTKKKRWWHRSPKTPESLTTSYLLDKFELNVKSRCVFAWSDPEFRGFTIEDNAKISLEAALEARAAYFESGLSVGHQMTSDFTADRRLLYHDRKELRESLRNGAVFVAIVTVLDMFIRTL